MRPGSSTAETAVARPLVTTIGDYFELTKPTIVWLILMSTVVAFYLASDGPLAYWLLFHTVVGTALLAGGSGALNQWFEREADGKMRRTENRPLPAGRLASNPALWFGVAISVAGMIYLFAAVNPLTALIGLLTLASYLFLYTPLKSRTWLSTFVGAFPGAAPPLIGWAAVRNDLGWEAWVLFAILFLWQFPHFYAIAWMYREDYARAGILMLPVVEPDGASTGRQIVAYAALLVPISLAPTWLGLTGSVYFFGALAVSLFYLFFGVLCARRKTGVQARRLLQASVLYLPLIYCFLVLNKT
jgi:protoheme IX farnesyltransferase